jgi:hypothetical protein
MINLKAMCIAELFEELYREASRFVLDNPGRWPEQELNALCGAPVRHYLVLKLKKW